MLTTCVIGKITQRGSMNLTLTGDARDRSLTVDGGPLGEPIALERCASGGPAIAGDGPGGEPGA